MPEETPTDRTESAVRAGPLAEQPMARILADVHKLVDDSPVPAGARWKLTEPGRQLDANLVHLPAGQRVDTHVEPDLDVVLLVVAGGGVAGTPAGSQPVANGNLVWLPRGSTRFLTAGKDGVSI